MRLLLDTHTWVWISLDTSRIKFQARQVLKLEKEPLHVSAVSLYEVATLSRRGRIDLNIPMQAWFDLAFVDASLTLLPVSPNVPVNAALLPDDFHGDPFRWTDQIG